ncbi:propanediol utilization protein [Harenicola maris]|uniref:propanediol utilization protein n=1 Tax=Harenicola maris TaxID=2841044 RepID=UPI002E18B30D
MTANRITVQGHFGELIQGTLGPDGPLALISLPCPALTLTAETRPAPALRVAGSASGLLAAPKAASLLAELRLDYTARLSLRCDMPPGGGAGASTAALVALARAAGYSGRPQQLAEACQAVEGATDPLMFPAPERLLWGSRTGRIVAELPALPAFDVVGGFFGPLRRTNPNDESFPDISDLIEPWVEAALAQDLPALARLASTSAELCLAMRGPQDDPSAELAQSLGALGYVIAHTGNARGFLFPTGEVPEDAEDVLEEARFDATLTFSHGPAL